MKIVFAAMALFFGINVYAQEPVDVKSERGVDWGCYIDVMEDSVLASRYNSFEECSKLCQGGSAVCQKMKISSGPATRLTD